ncbi:aldose epimerase family protein [Paraburkholderia caribensis MBA4]|uniref:Aldose epimerase family protein n=2 Tax=Paraburkholderia caribensis TaxID=75105 RepID=A0A0P0R5N0_9BURK|nr:aldose epimerase family protein [Paraburkholderia caribensis MBA4]
MASKRARPTMSQPPTPIQTTMREASLHPSAADPATDLQIDDPSLVVLASGDTTLVVAPEVGGSIAAYFDVVREPTSQRVLHWLRPATRAALASRDPLRMASFPLFPYCNRIRDARFEFGGRTVDLGGDGNGYAHALHGHAWRRPWRIGARTATSVELHFEHVPDADAPGDWPFRYRAIQRIELLGDALRVTLAVQSLSKSPMPFGMGHHPYYPRTSNTVITAHVEAMWHADAQVLPTHLGPHGAVDALRCGMSADAFELDNNFSGWTRSATIAWPDERRSVSLTAAAPFDHLVVFAPANDAQLCVEPVTNTTDCFNANANDGARERAGYRVLQPGETLSAELNWTPRRD